MTHHIMRISFTVQQDGEDRHLVALYDDRDMEFDEAVNSIPNCSGRDDIVIMDEDQFSRIFRSLSEEDLSEDSELVVGSLEHSDVDDLSEDV